MTPKELALSFFPDDPVMRGRLISAIIESIAAEREACAELAKSMIGATRHEIAAAIRARNNKTK